MSREQEDDLELDNEVKKSVLQVDLKNAFNMVDRDAGLQETEQHYPECLSWVLTCYGAESELMYGDRVVKSSTGFHQGDPLAGQLFAATLHPVIEKINLEVPELEVNAWLHDDGTLVGTNKQLQRAVDVILQDGPARGLYLSTAATVRAPAKPKSTVWCPRGSTSQETDPIQRGIKVMEVPGIILLGSPLGDQEYTEQGVRDRISKVRNITEMLPLIQDPHLEFVLLRSCLSLPKVMYTLRTVDPTSMQLLWQEFDSVTREALCRILGSPLTDLQWQQAKLPVSMGGMGLRAAEDHSAAAYCTSFLLSQPLIRDLLHLPPEESSATLPPALLHLLSAKQGVEATSESLEGVSQKMASLAIDLNNKDSLLQHYTREGKTREVARLNSLGLPHAGEWLNVVPSPSLGLNLRSLEFVMVAKYRLGIYLYQAAGPCPACGRPSDRLGDHAMCCGYQGERISRHNQLRDAIYQTAVSAALAPTKEGRFLLPGTDRRPADVLVPGWTAGRDTALDVTVINPLQSLTLAGAAADPGHALKVAYDRKMGAVAADCSRQGITFIPMAAESLGGWHKVAVDQVLKLGGALARNTGQEEQEAKQQLWQKLSILLMKGNAALFTNRIPAVPE